MPPATRSEAFAWVALGGGLGALARWGAPVDLVWVNTLGCALIAVVVTLVPEGRWRIAAGPGFLGGFTSFSGYLAAADAAEHPLVHAAVAAIACLLAVAVGRAVAAGWASRR